MAARGAARAAVAAAVSALVLLSVPAAPARAAEGTLVSDFQAALAYDPQWRAALATRDAGIEARVQGRAALLPQASFSAQLARANGSATIATAAGPLDRDNNYDSYNYALTVRQPLYKPRAMATYRQGVAQEAYANATLRAARQELALRLVSAVADWVAYGADRDAVRVTLASAELTLATAERSLQAGDGTRVDVETARARVAQARAQEADLDGKVQAAALAWRQITGLEGAPRVTAGGDGLGPVAPAPSSLAAIEQAALERNGVIEALTHAVEAARQEAEKARSDHLPSIDAFASRTLSKSDTEANLGNRYDTTRLGVQLSVPLYAGGALDSVVRQAAANLRRAQNELDATRLRVKLQVERDWHDLEAANAEHAAARSALEAWQLAEYAARLGLGAGTSTRVDVARAANEGAMARRDLVRSSARRLAAWARLMSAMDQLDETSLAAADVSIAAASLSR